MNDELLTQGGMMDDDGLLTQESMMDNDGLLTQEDDDGFGKSLQKYKHHQLDFIWKCYPPSSLAYIGKTPKL